jgi:hypothetical protein
VFLQPEAADLPPGGWDRLVALGVLRELPPAACTTCTGCGGGHIVRVVAVPAAGGGMALRVPCPECGPVPIAPDALRRWEVDVPALLAGVAAAGGMRAGPEAAVVPHHLWFLGTARWAGRPRQAYFARAVHGQPRAAVLAALGPYPGAVLFHPTERAARAWGATPNPVCSLEATVAVGPVGLVFDPAAVEARLADSAPLAPPGEKDAPPKRAVRLANIERLVKEMREHLREAREHAYAKRDLTGAAELPPRPTRKALGERVGLAEWDVSRCFSDRSGVLLKHLWAAALDLDQVLAFRG